MDPRIINMKVWEIGEKPVFYGYDDEDSVYSIIDKTIVKKPSHLNLISARDLEPKDLADVILHNQLSEEDFSSLLRCNLIPPELEALFKKIQELQKQLNHLRNEKTEKSENSEKEEKEEVLNKTALEALINVVKNGLLGAGPSVFEQIVEGTRGLSEQDKKLLKLVSSHFSLDKETF